MLLFRLIAFIPKFLLGPMASFLTVLLCLLAKKDILTIRKNVELVYKLPLNADFSRDFSRQVIKTQLLLFFETIRYIFRPHEVSITGLDEARQKLESASENSGVVIIAAHHGAWELAGHCAAMFLKRDFYALAKPSRLGWFTGVLDDFRRRLGMKVLWTDSKSLLKDMMAVANRNEHLGFVMDQRPSKRTNGYECRFLGVEGTPIVQGPALMAAKKNMPVYGIHAVRLGGCRYQFQTTEVLSAGHGLTDEVKITQLMADDLTQMIFRYPEQWAWNYRRWKL